jgi:putative membrane protein
MIQPLVDPPPDFDPRSIRRPDPVLLRYYLCVAALTGPGFPFVLLPLACKYYTLRYRIDEDGISMSWGALFRRDIFLTYRRIQDIHLSRNLLQRWMGLATVSIQTASGSSTPEMSIEGILRPDDLRDFLYRRMRGAKGEAEETDATPPGAHAGAEPASSGEALTVLHDIRDLLRDIQAQGKAAP